MFTRTRIPPFTPTGDWAKDGPQLTRWISDYFQSLERKNVLSIRQAELYVDQGLQFPATQVASSDPNNLDDYEEGSWTPAITFTTPGTLSVSYSVQDGRYTKIGNLVLASFSITTSGFTLGTASGSLRITGLPFTINAADGNYTSTGPLQWQGITKANYTQIVTSGASGQTSLGLNASGSGQNLVAIAAGDTPTGGTIVLRGALLFTV